MLSVCVVSLCCQFAHISYFLLCFYDTICKKNFRIHFLLPDFTNDGTFTLLQSRFQWNSNYTKERPNGETERNGVRFPEDGDSF